MDELNLYPHVCAVRLTEEQWEYAMKARGALSMSAYLRLLVVQDQRRKMRVDPADVPN